MPAGPRHREPRRPARLALEPGQTVTWLLRQALPVAVWTGPPPMCGGRFPLAGLQRPRAGQAFGLRPPPWVSSRRFAHRLSARARFFPRKGGNAPQLPAAPRAEPVTSSLPVPTGRTLPVPRRLRGPTLLLNISLTLTAARGSGAEREAWSLADLVGLEGSAATTGQVHPPPNTPLALAS